MKVSYNSQSSCVKTGTFDIIIVLDAIEQTEPLAIVCIKNPLHFTSRISVSRNYPDYFQKYFRCFTRCTDLRTMCGTPFYGRMRMHYHKTRLGVSQLSISASLSTVHQVLVMISQVQCCFS